MSFRVQKNIYYLLVPADHPNGGFVQQTLNNLPGNNRQVISWLLGGKVIQLWVSFTIYLKK